MQPADPTRLKRRHPRQRNVRSATTRRSSDAGPRELAPARSPDTQPAQGWGRPGGLHRGFIMLSRALNNSNVLGLIFMLPLTIILVIFLTYPLGLGVWLGFTDAKIGRAGEWIGLGN